LWHSAANLIRTIIDKNTCYFTKARNTFSTYERTGKNNSLLMARHGDRRRCGYATESGKSKRSRQLPSIAALATE
jgi:hypothetical protein